MWRLRRTSFVSRWPLLLAAAVLAVAGPLTVANLRPHGEKSAQAVMAKLERGLAEQDADLIAGLISPSRKREVAAGRLTDDFGGLRPQDVDAVIDDSPFSYIVSGRFENRTTSETVAGPFQIEYLTDDRFFRSGGGWFLGEGDTHSRKPEDLGPKIGDELGHSEVPLRRSRGAGWRLR